ncbi:arylesterase [Tahibacter harae]|uniref:Arylesterase n=1 Tax=Tahibacter harae TaxID=2963937 RepID=A0ABT1QSM1_9GAMM|nr:arylesterase [Tahibacter harae]MCQ4165269.1 arylesterase [Tahibacter harae]
MRRFLELIFLFVSFVSNAATPAAHAAAPATAPAATVAAEPASATAATGSVLVLGDSLSAAHGIARDAGWVNLLQQRLAAAAPARSVVNASISGETTAGGLARLPALLTQNKPAIVLIELGANDGLRGLPLSEISANLKQMLELVRKSGAKAVLAGIELPVNYGPQYRDGLRAIYRDLAGEFNVPLVPFLLEGVALQPELIQDDGLHPTAQAQGRILENVWSVVGPVLK